VQLVLRYLQPRYMMIFQINTVPILRTPVLDQI
jgi:hypothetical protein